MKRPPRPTAAATPATGPRRPPRAGQALPAAGAAATALDPAAAVDPAALDLGHLALFVGYAVADAVLAALADAGHGELRTSHGFLFQHLIGAERTVGELATRMSVSQQAVSKVVAELEALGYVERAADGHDGRVRRVRLTARGRDAVAAARRARAAVDRRLDERCGPGEVERARATLAAALDALGGAGAVRHRRVVPPR